MIHTILNSKKIVLASASPRRAEIFRLIGLAPEIIPANIDEPITSKAPHLQAIQHASNKAKSVRQQVDKESVIIGADTIVVVEKRILGKPKDLHQAAKYLHTLSGRTHKVYTGVCIMQGDKAVSGYALSYVKFAQLSEREISEYLQTQEPMDKAGAYGIQGYGSQFIESIKGCYFNVMGFPINLFYNLLDSLISGKG